MCLSQLSEKGVDSPLAYLILFSDMIICDPKIYRQLGSTILRISAQVHIPDMSLEIQGYSLRKCWHLITDSTAQVRSVELSSQIYEGYHRGKVS